MASRLRIVGFGILIVGVLLFSVFNILWFAIPPFGGRTEDTPKWAKTRRKGFDGKDLFPRLFIGQFPIRIIAGQQIPVILDGDVGKIR